METFDIDDLSEKADRLGYFRGDCDVCRGAGVSKRPDGNAPTGVRVEDPCRSCGGSGGWWLPNAARSGAIIPPLTDAEFAELAD